MPSGWNAAGGNSLLPYGGFSAFLREDEGKLNRNGNGNSNGSSVSGGRVKAEAVIEAATLAANGQPFEVVYYPRASTPEFCVKGSLVKTALQVRWCSGMRFKMAFETEDSSRISWFMGTISSVQVADPIRWPDSPWRLLQVSWDEPDLLQNVKRVNPWLVELVSNMPTMHLSPFSPPRKKLRLPHHPEFPLDGQVPLPSFPGNHLLGSSNPFGYHHDSTPAGMQGARHAQYGLSLSDFHLSKLHPGLFPHGLMPLDRSSSMPTGVSNPIVSKPTSNENISCLLTIGSSTQPSKQSDKLTPFVLFGQTILTEKQISMSCSSETVSPVRNGQSSSDGNGADKVGNTSEGSGSRSGSALNQNDATQRSSCEGYQSDLSLETGHCKVFMESEDVGRTLDLSLLGSYEELYRKLATMFGTEVSETAKRVHYRDAAGAVRQLGGEPFSNFMKTAKRLTILANPNSSDNIGV